MIQGVPDRTYYIVFRETHASNLPLFWVIIFKLFFRGKNSGWEHVSVFYPISDSKIVSLELTPWQLGVAEHELTLEEALEDLRGRSKACVQFKSRTEKDNYKPRGIITCVSLAKAILGLRAFKVIMPKQLFNLLISKGGKKLWQTL